MATTIQITQELQNELIERKVIDSETYEEVIWDLIEDCMEISAETKKEIETARKEIKQGKVFTLDQVKQEIES